MAHTIYQAACAGGDHRSAQQAAAAGRKRHRPLNIKAARIMSSQEIAALPPVKRARSSQSEEDSDTDDEEVRTPPCHTIVPSHQYFRL